MAHDVERILRVYDRQVENRRNWDWHWQEVKELVWPHAGDFLVKRVQGDKRVEKVYDPTAALALEKHAAAMEAMVIPRSQRYQKIVPSTPELKKDRSVMEWFENVTQIVFDHRNAPRAAFYTNMHPAFKSLGAFGTDCIFVDSLRGGGYRFKNIHIGEVHFQVNHLGESNTVYRKFRMTAKAAEDKWGSKVLSLNAPKVFDSLSDGKDPWMEHDFLHLVTPREDIDPENPGVGGMNFLSLYISMDDKNIVGESGYHEMPYIISRYTLNPDENWGRSPAMMVLPSIKMSQEMKKTFIRAGHRVVSPPILVHDDGILGTGASSAIRLHPDGINYGAVDSQGRALMQPFVTGARLDINEAMLQKENDIQNDAFLVSLFQILVDRPQMTATEALIRAQEKGQLLAPPVGRQQSEKLGPITEREVGILNRQGRLPPPPQAIIEAEGEYQVEYESPAQRFQKSDELIGIQRTLETASLIAQYDPTVMEIFDGPEIIRIAGEINGAPLKAFRTPEEVEERQAAREKEEKEAKEMAMLREGTAALKDGAQGLQVLQGGASGEQTGAA